MKFFNVKFLFLEMHCSNVTTNLSICNVEAVNADETLVVYSAASGVFKKEFRPLTLSTSEDECVKNLQHHTEQDTV